MGDGSCLTRAGAGPEGAVTGSVSIPHDPSAVPGARRALVRSVSGDPGCRGAADDAAVVASELLGNAVRHADALDGSVVLRWCCGGAQVVLEVVDGGGGGEPQDRPASEDATSGRGLAIVSALAAQWGSRTDGHGHRAVWARIAVPPGR